MLARDTPHLSLGVTMILPVPANASRGKTNHAVRKKVATVR